MNDPIDRVLWRKHLRRLRRIAPIDGRVRVVLVNTQSDDCGGVLMSKGDHRVSINANLGFEAALDSLHHEWAHILRFEAGAPDPTVHDDAFWIEYGALYRAWLRCA